MKTCGTESTLFSTVKGMIHDGTSVLLKSSFDRVEINGFLVLPCEKLSVDGPPDVNQVYHLVERPLYNTVSLPLTLSVYIPAKYVNFEILEYVIMIRTVYGILRNEI